MAEAPRISFSREIENGEIASDVEGPRDANLALDPSSGEFNFNTGCNISFKDPSIADEIFSHGMILPLFKLQDPIGRSHSPPPPPPPVTGIDTSHRELIDSVNGSAKDSLSGSLRRFLWRFSRSSSVGREVKPHSGRIFPFSLFRSKSTSSARNSMPNQVRRRHQAWRQKKSYYLTGSHGTPFDGGVPLRPVLNMPVSLFSRGSKCGEHETERCLFSYLLCTCRSRGVTVVS